jgi:polar amino acid transport system substrate-binding protein
MKVVRRLSRPPLWGLIVAAVLAIAIPAYAASGSSAGPAAASAASAPLANLLPASIRKAGSLVIATDASYPPCEYFPKPGAAMVGFEPDLWNAMGALLGVKIKPVNTAFDGLIPGVQSGRYPVAMECISDSLAREGQVSFVDFVYDNEGVYLLKKNASEITTSPLSLCGKTAAAQSGLDFVGFITNIIDPYCKMSGKPPIALSQFPSESAVLLALYTGRVDFSLDDLAALAYLERSAPQPVLLRTDSLLPKLYLGMVVNKQETQLAKALLAADKELITNGTYAKVLAKWKIPQLALLTPGINLAKSNPLPIPKP